MGVVGYLTGHWSRYGAVTASDGQGVRRFGRGTGARERMRAIIAVAYAGGARTGALRQRWFLLIGLGGAVMAVAAGAAHRERLTRSSCARARQQMCSSGLRAPAWADSTWLSAGCRASGRSPGWSGSTARRLLCPQPDRRGVGGGGAAGWPSWPPARTAQDAGGPAAVGRPPGRGHGRSACRQGAWPARGQRAAAGRDEQ